MPNMQERLNAAVDRAEVDTGLLHEVVHGDMATEVDTEGGKVPSVAKAINDIRVIIDADAKILHDITHGDSTTVVITENGEVPSAAKTVQEIREYIQNGTDDLVLQAQNAAEMAKAWAIKTDAPIQGLDYSSKHYAEAAAEIAGRMDKKADTLAGHGILDGVAYEPIIDDKIELTLVYPDTMTYSVIK